MKHEPLLPPETLREARHITDPVADAVVDLILAEDVVKINDVFNTITRNRDLAGADLPPYVRAYFKEQATLPPWMDSELVDIGQDVFRRYGIEVSILLNYLSLPTAYACPKGAKVLFATGRLTEKDGNIDRLAYRLMETAQFVVDVMQPGAFGPESNGVETALRIRLIHASIRHFLRTKGNWNVAENGEPINQEDMAGTLQSFSSMVIHGLLQMGVPLSEREQEGYYHCWRVVGHLIGLQPEMVPKIYPEGLRLGFQILEDQKGRSDEGKALMVALMDFILYLEPVHIFGRYLPALMIRYFVHDNIGDVITVGKVPEFWERFLYRAFRFFIFLQTLFGRPRHHWVKNHIDGMKHSFLQKMLDRFNHHKKIWFDIPPALRDDWKIDDSGRIVGRQ